MSVHRTLKGSLPHPHLSQVPTEAKSDQEHRASQG